MTSKKICTFLIALTFPFLICAQEKSLATSSDSSEVDEYSQDSLDKEEALRPEQEKKSVVVQPKAVVNKVDSKDRNRGIPIDLNVPKFSDTPQGKQYIREHGEPKQADESGYPQMQFPSSERFAKDIQKKMQVSEKAKLKVIKILPKPLIKIHPKPVIKPVIKPDPKKIVTPKKTTFIQQIFELLIPSAHAYEEDVNFNSSNNPNGLVHCRTNSAQLGYFKVYFEDVMFNTNDGYDDGANGLTRRQVACAILEDLSALLNINNLNVKPDIIFTKDLPPGTPSNAVASARSFYGYYESGKKIDNGSLHLHITSGQDPTPSPGYYDAVVNTNWNLPIASSPLPAQPYIWSTDVTGYPMYPAPVPVPNPLQGAYPNVLDFPTTIKHEILHALGFASKLPFTVTQSGTEIVHNLFSEFLYEVSGGAAYFTFPQPMDAVLQVPNSVSPTPWSSWYANGNQGIYRGKKNYSNSTLDPERPLYTPTSFASGSSLSHFDMYRAGTVYTMHPMIAPWSIRPLHNDEKEVLCHLGYEVVGLCNGKTPFANNDMVEFTAINVPGCVKFLDNDRSFTGTAANNLAINEFQNVALPAGTTFFFYPNSSDCGVSGSTSTSNNPIGAKSIKVTAPSFPVSFKYKVKDTISGRISDAALIFITNCAASGEEYVCNGDFELGVIPGFNIFQANNQAFGYQKVPFWKTAAFTPDMIGKNPAFAPSPYNYPWTNAQGFTIDMVDNGKFAALVAFQRTQGNNNWGLNYQNEKISGKLKTNLTVGEIYTLSYDVALFGAQGNFGSTFNTWAVLKTTDMSINPSTSPPPTPWTSATVIVDQPLTISYVANTPQATWHHVAVDFVADQTYNFVAVGMPYINTPVPSNVWSILDNVSIKKANRNSISGVVYIDSNNDHTRNGPGEDGINGVQVGLFDSVTGAMIGQPVLTENVQTSPTVSDDGHYSFPYLTIPGSNSYYVALVTENSYLPITEPLQNTASLIIGKQYVQQVPFTGGYVVGVNFGVLAPLPNIELNAIPSISCKKGGSVNLTVAGGTPPFTYSWSNGMTSEDIGGVVPGTYTVTVTDSAIPVQTATLSVMIPALPQITISGGVSGGSIDITASGANPLTYSWSNASTTQDLTNVAPGTYTVTVTDANQCTQSATYTIAGPQSGACCKIKPNANPLVDCSDPMMNLGSTTVEDGRNRCDQFNQGNSCFWDFSNPACCYPGATGCGSVGLILNTTGKPSCDGKTGGIALTVSGGTAPYTYLWSNGQTTQNATNIGPGTYTVTVTSANGLTGTATVTLQNIGPVVISGVVTSASAPNFNNGAINITVTPAIGYIYAWTKAGGGWSSTLEDVSNLVVGSYTVTATNEFSCKASKSITVKKVLKITPKDIIKNQ